MLTNENQTNNRRGSDDVPVTINRWQALANSFSFDVAIISEKDGGFSAIATRYPGIVSQGDTFDEALDNIKEALAAAIESSLARGQLLPAKANWMDVPPGSKRRRVSINV